MWRFRVIPSLILTKSCLFIYSKKKKENRWRHKRRITINFRHTIVSFNKPAVYEYFSFCVKIQWVYVHISTIRVDKKEYLVECYMILIIFDNCTFTIKLLDWTSATDFWYMSKFIIFCRNLTIPQYHIHPFLKIENLFQLILHSIKQQNCKELAICLWHMTEMHFPSDLTSFKVLLYKRINALPLTSEVQ